MQKILLVDDDPIQLKLCALRLRDAGFEVDVAASGEEALERAERTRPDAIVSDVLMRGLDGFALCRAVREDARLARVPVILLSAYLQGPADQTRAHEAGASALVLRTPCFDVELEALREALATCAAAVDDTTGSVCAEETRGVTCDKYRALLEKLPDVIWTMRGDGQLTFMTPNVEKMGGFTCEAFCSNDASFWMGLVHEDDAARVTDAYATLLREHRLLDIEYRMQRRDGEWMWVWQRVISSYEQEGVRFFDGITSDLTDKKQLEDTLRQSQKMETIGQLTGGIAHDFNNLLAVILANTDFLLDALGPTDPRREDANDIRTAATRAAGLTRQLLAFSRRQVLELAHIDLGSTVGNVEKMLRRTLGEDIELSVVRGAELGTVLADAGQMEQVLLNLAVNARDAMPQGGKLCIETSNVDLDEASSPRDASVAPGRYVMVAVTDTGCGMDAETRRRAFEPFFTTKEKDRGTGLGLSTCYGIVKQSGGYLALRSEPGVGTVFEIWLPRIDPAAHDAVAPVAVVPERGGSEMILLVEDDDHLRAALARMLRARGYEVSAMRDGAEALAATGHLHRPIDLVLSDVVVPGASGPAIAASVQGVSARTRVLFMSGYTDHAALKNGELERGPGFIQKPFSATTLARKVREVLDA